MSTSTAKGRKAWSTGNGPVWAPAEQDRGVLWRLGGDIDDTRMECMQPKRAGFSLMDCLPSLLPWGQ